jgi:class 3 adenylate cyclase
MDTAHLGSGNRICTVVFVDLVQYSAEPVSKQAEMKAWFSALVARAIEHTPVADRLVLDTGDGAALCFLGDPEDALFVANTIRSGVLETAEPHSWQLRLGINLGPVRVVKDINGHSNVIGDGINVAQRVMSFAAPNQILVSRSYFEVVSRLSPEYGQLFHYMGAHRDKHVREHEVYEVQLSPGPAAPGATQPPRPPAALPGGTDEVARFDPAVLARLTAALAREIGPVAKLIVQRAAERAPDGGVLCAALAESVPAPDRAAFLAALADLSRAQRSVAEPSRAPGGPESAESMHAAAGVTREITPAVLARAARALTNQIGPVGHILVRQAAKSAVTSRELFENLAAHIGDEQVRKAFLAEADRTG